MEATQTIQELAQYYYDFLETARRDDGTEYVKRKDDAPDELEELCRNAHAGMFPDDWRYRIIESTLGIIADLDDIDEYDEAVDNAVSIYTADRLSWLSSRFDRAGYVDEAVAELGRSDQGIVGDIAVGEYAERCEVFNLVKAWLTERIEA